MGPAKKKQGRLLTMLPIIAIWSPWALVSHLQKWIKEMSQGSCEVQISKMDTMTLLVMLMIKICLSALKYAVFGDA